MDDTLSLLQRLLSLFAHYFAPPSSAAAAAPANGMAATAAAAGTAGATAAAAAAGAGGGGAPNLTQIVGWLNVLIDAHFTRLLMHRPCHGLLTSLSDLSRRHVKTCAALKSLKGYLKQTTHVRSAQPARPVAQYSVERIDL